MLNDQSLFLSLIYFNNLDIFKFLLKLIPTPISKQGGKNCIFPSAISASSSSKRRNTRRHHPAWPTKQTPNLVTNNQMHWLTHSSNSRRVIGINWTNHCINGEIGRQWEEGHRIEVHPVTRITFPVVVFSHHRVTHQTSHFYTLSSGTGVRRSTTRNK